MAIYATRPLMGSIPINDGSTYMALVGGDPVFVEAGSLSVEDTIGKRGQASFRVHGDTSTHFQQDQQVVIYDADNNLAFSGFIAQPEEEKPGFQPSLDTRITCVDNQRLADKRIIARVYTNMTRTQIVRDIAQTILAQEGVTIGAIVDEASNVQTLYPGPTLYPSPTLYPQGSPAVGVLSSAVFAYCKASAALDALTKDANLAGVPYYWSIDKYRQFWWVPYTFIVNNATIDGTAIDQLHTRPKVTRANPAYRNTQYVVGGVAQTSLQNETIVGDGNKRSFPLGYDLASAPTIVIGGVTQTTALKGGTGAQFYWAQGDNTIVQDSSQTVLASAATGSVAYIGQYPSVAVESNNAQIDYEKNLDGTSGIVEEVEQDPTITSLSDAIAKTGGLLTRYAVQGKSFTFTIKGNPNGYASGQLVPVVYAPHGLNEQMLIEKVVGSDQIDGVNIWYSINAVVGPVDTTWTDFFSAIVQQQQPANSINVGVSQSLVLLQQFSAGMAIGASLDATAVACPLPSPTLYPSPLLFPC